MMQLNRTILIDCDGVLLNWVDAFIVWMGKRGFKTNDRFYGDYGLHKWFQIEETVANQCVKLFNESADIGFLTAMPKAPVYLKKLIEAGFQFKVITSLSDNPYSRNLRIMNLERIFGKDAFLDVISLETRACKKEELTRQKKFFGDNVETIWIDDHVYNLDVTKDIGGYIPICFAQLHNSHYRGERVDDWEDLHYKVLNIENMR